MTKESKPAAMSDTGPSLVVTPLKSSPHIPAMGPFAGLVPLDVVAKADITIEKPDGDCGVSPDGARIA